MLVRPRLPTAAPPLHISSYVEVMRTCTPEQAAEVLQVTVGTVRKLARDGKLQGAKIGQHWRFSEYQIEQFLEQPRRTKE